MRMGFVRTLMLGVNIPPSLFACAPGRESTTVKLRFLTQKCIRCRKPCFSPHASDNGVLLFTNYFRLMRTRNLSFLKNEKTSQYDCWEGRECPRHWEVLRASCFPRQLSLLSDSALLRMRRRDSLCYMETRCSEMKSSPLEFQAQRQQCRPGEYQLLSRDSE